MVVWEGNGRAGSQLATEIFGQRLDPNGVPSGGSFSISSVNGLAPAVSYSGEDDQFLVLWHHDLGSLQQEVFGAVLAADGARLGPGNFRVSLTPAAGSSRDSVNAALAFNPVDHQYLLAFQADGLVGANTDDVGEVFAQLARGFAPDLRLTKDDGDASGVPGGLVRYALDYSNAGDVAAPDATLTETVPQHTTFDAAASSPGWSCVPDGNAGSTCTLDVGVVPVGASASVDFAVRIDLPVPAGVVEIQNAAAIAAAGASDLDPGDNSDVDSTPVDAAPDLSIAKDDGGVSVLVGETILYTLSFENRGDQDATGVTITETVPADTSFDPAASTPGWSCVPDASAGSTCSFLLGDLAAGVSGSLTFAAAVDSPLPPGVDRILNAATIADDGANGPDPNPGDNVGSDETPILPQPDLRITKEDGGARAAPGDSLAYTLSFANDGPASASGVTITDTVPAHTTFDAAASTPGWFCAPGGSAGSVCTLGVGTVAGGGGSGSVAFVVTVDNPLPAGVSQIENTASIADDASSGPDLDPTDNEDAAVTPVLTPAEQVEAILDLFDTAAADGTLTGVSNGNARAAANHLRGMRKKLAKLTRAGNASTACSQLQSALDRTDGVSPPPDWVSGPAAAELARMIEELRTRLGCD
jgi:uncharacterized repeat protein (TIGR01451 family)